MVKVRSVPYFYSPIGFQKLTVEGTAVGFTLPSSPETRAVVFTVETAPIRVRMDGTAPDSTTGMLLKAGDLVEITNTEAIADFQAIRISASATLQIHFFGGGFA